MRYIFTGGKGGVGKTVAAAGLAYHYAAQGERVLLASLNPVHSLSSLFGQSLSGGKVVQVQGAKGGEAVEFLRNRTRMQQKYLDEIRSKFAGKVVASLPMYPREPRGLDMIEKVSQDLFFGPGL